MAHRMGRMTSLGEKIVFLHVPKTGGTWAARAMEAAGVDLRDVGMHADLQDLSRFEGRYRIAFVREPLSWYRSWWVHRQTFGDWKDEPLDKLGRTGFDEFLQRAMDTIPGYVTSLFEQFTGPADRQIEFVGRYERLLDDLVQALRAAGVTFDEAKLRGFPPTNVSSREIPAECSTQTRERLKETERRAYQRFYPEHLLAGSHA
jgi:hypothetical protein